MASPARRTWTLAGLDRTGVYRLWFDHGARRWEVEQDGAAGKPVTQAAGTAGGALDAHAAKRGAAGVTADPEAGATVPRQPDRSAPTWPAPV